MSKILAKSQDESLRFKVNGLEFKKVEFPSTQEGKEEDQF
jgi:hypothetical protein